LPVPRTEASRKPVQKSTVVKAGLSHPVRRCGRSSPPPTSKPGDSARVATNPAGARAPAHKIPRGSRASSAAAIRASLAGVRVPPLTHSLDTRFNRLISDDQLTPKVVSGVQTSSLACRSAVVPLPGSISAKAVKSRPKAARVRVDFRWLPTASAVYRWRRAVAADYR
jgi:hypothetical protein